MRGKKAKQIRKAIYGDDHAHGTREYERINAGRDNRIINSPWSLRYAYQQCKRFGKLV